MHVTIQTGNDIMRFVAMEAEYSSTTVNFKTSPKLEVTALKLLVVYIVSRKNLETSSSNNCMLLLMWELYCGTMLFLIRTQHG